MNRRGSLLLRSAKAALMAGALAGAAMSLPAVALAQDYRFTTVNVEGNQRVDAATIITFAGIGRGEALTAAELNDAYQRIVDSGLFESVAISPNGNRLNITVQEYPTINRINIEGNRRIDDDILLPQLKSQSRRVYNPVDAEADAATLAEAYGQQGRLSASVEPRIIRRSENRVDLVFEVVEGRPVEIERISFIGNNSFSERKLRNALNTSQAGLLRQFIGSDTFIEDRIAFDRRALTDFYNSRGFIDFRVLSVSSELTRQRDGVFLTFNVREGQSYSISEAKVVSELEEVEIAAFADALRIRQGQTYSPGLIENNIARLERLAIEKQLNFIRVQPRLIRNEADATLQVEFVVERGPRIFVERIDIEGNSTTLDRVVRRQFDSVEGDPFNPRAIRQSAERIRALGFFSKADVTSRRGSADDRVVVDVNVEEAPTGSLSFGGSYSIQDGLGLSVSLAERNFLGRGQQLSFSYSGGTSDRITSLRFVEPSFLARDVAFTFSGLYEVTTQDTAKYDTEVIDISLGLEFPVSDNGRLSLTAGVGQAELSNVHAGSSPIITREAGKRDTHSIGYVYTFDTRRTGLNPNAGVLLRFGQEFSGLGSDNQLVSTTALASAQTKVWNEEVTLRFDLEGGVVSGIGGGTTRVTDRFFTNNSNFRGWQGFGIGPRDLGAANTDALGGNYYAVARLESQFPLGLPEEYNITGGVFLDIGSVWGLTDKAGATGTVDDEMNLRATLGFAVYWETVVGPLRFNFTTPLKKEDYDRSSSFDLSISTSF